MNPNQRATDDSSSWIDAAKSAAPQAQCAVGSEQSAKPKRDRDTQPDQPIVAGEGKHAGAPDSGKDRSKNKAPVDKPWNQGGKR